MSDKKNDTAPGKSCRRGGRIPNSITSGSSALHSASPYARPIPPLTGHHTQHQFNSGDQPGNLTRPSRQPPLIAAHKHASYERPKSITSHSIKLPEIVSRVQNFQQQANHVESSIATSTIVPDTSLLHVSADTGLGSTTSDRREESGNAVSSAAAGKVAEAQPAVVEGEDLDVLIITISDKELAADAWMFK